MSVDFSNPIHSLKDVDDVTETLKVQFPNSVKIEIDHDKGEIRIPQLNLKLKGDRPISAGWTARIAIVQGIDRRYTLRDAIVLPMIAPEITVPVEGGTADIPRDVTKSDDEWAVEWYIVDPVQNSALLFRSQPQSLKKTHHEGRKQVPEKTTDIVEHDRGLSTWVNVDKVERKCTIHSNPECGWVKKRADGRYKTILELPLSDLGDPRFGRDGAWIRFGVFDEANTYCETLEREKGYRKGQCCVIQKSNDGLNKRIQGLEETKEYILAQIAELEQAIPYHDTADDIARTQLLRWQLKKSQKNLREINDKLRSLQ